MPLHSHDKKIFTSNTVYIYDLCKKGDAYKPIINNYQNFVNEKGLNLLKKILFHKKSK